MKYIRTRWSIYEVVEETELVYRVKAKWHNNHIYSKSKRQTEVLKQADTIEELCDEFVIEYPSGEFDTLNHDYSAKLKYMGMERYNAEINHGWCKLYGAIWTDKGLIYVAKINDKGELELL